MSEHDQQVALMQWVNVYAKQRPEAGLLFAIPNGGKRNIVTAVKLKREGVKAGVPDLFLPVARGGYNGLFIEMKTKSGRLSESQKDYIFMLEEQKYKVIVCKQWELATYEIKSYLEGD